MDLLCTGKFYQYQVNGLNNAFVFPDREPPIINILYGRLGI